MTPIPLVDERGCTGRRFMGCGPLWGLCLTCELQGRGGPQIPPEARRDAERVAQCPNWRSATPTSSAASAAAEL